MLNSNSPLLPVISKSAALKLALTQDLTSLLDSANKLRIAEHGNKIELCAIINARSGNCGMDCKFCSQSSHNSTRIDTFPLLENLELDKAIGEFAKYPIERCGIVTSGGALGAKESNNDELKRLATYIKNYNPEQKPKLCASLGRLTQSSLEQLQEAGLTRYHHNLESSEGFYPSLCSTQKWQDRANTVKAAKEAGLSVCCGGLFGTGESWENRIDFAFELRELGVDNIPINFLYPHPGTPMANMPILSADEALRIIAIFRHILPSATLRICGGRSLVLGERTSEIFKAGANALMTGNYLTTKGQSIENDLEMLQNLGLEAVI